MSFGIILPYDTRIPSGEWLLVSGDMNKWSLRDIGDNTSIPFFSAQILTGDFWIVSPRPFGLSVFVTTNFGKKPDFSSSFKTVTDISLEPKKTNESGEG